MICDAVRAAHEDVHRHEKISNIIKQFKLSCSKTQAQFATMQAGTSTPARPPAARPSEPPPLRFPPSAPRSPAPSGGTRHAARQVRNARYSAFIEGFTSTTYAMVIVSDARALAHPPVAGPGTSGARLASPPPLAPQASIQPATTLINIEASRAHFESLIAQLKL